MLLIRDRDQTLSRTIASHPDCGCGNVFAEPGDLACCDCAGRRYHLRRETGGLVLWRAPTDRAAERRAVVRYAVPATARALPLD